MEMLVKGEKPQHNLALDLVRVTEAAALAAARWLGRGDKESGDKAAVDAMRLILSSVDMRGVITIGEGEKDKAPMLFNGEKVGSGYGPETDVAVDPVDGTRLLAFGRPNAIAVVGVAPRGSMYNPGPAFYMDKIAVGSEARDVIDLDAPVADNLKKVARALGKNVEDLSIFVLDRPRHQKLISDIRGTGARILLYSDGDVAGALMAATPDSGVDLMMGIGGTPEGVLAACAVKAESGQFLGRLAPQSDQESKDVKDAGLDVDQILSVDDLVRDDDIFFAATGISNGMLLKGVQYAGNGATTYSMVMRGKTGTVRYIKGVHRWEKLKQVSAIDYD